jgi:hypothetical protein
MKRRFGILAGLVLALAGPSWAAERFSLSVWYGAARINPADLNGYFGDNVRWMKDIGYTLVPAAGLKTFDGAMGWEAAVSIPLGERVSLFASAGRIGSERLGNDINANNYTFKRDDALHATVVRLGVSYAVRLSSVLTLRPHVSADGYWGSFREDGVEISTWTDQPPQTDLQWTADVTAFTLGWSLGASLDVALGLPDTRNAGGTGSREPRFALSLDVGWRSARLTGFEGTFMEVNGGVAEGPVAFRLFHYEDFEAWMPSTYRNLNLPGAAGWGVVRNLRDAVLDLSGFSAAAGLKIFF